MIRYSDLGLQTILLEIIGPGSRVPDLGSWVSEGPGSWSRVPGPTFPTTQISKICNIYSSVSSQKICLHVVLPSVYCFEYIIKFFL